MPAPTIALRSAMLDRAHEAEIIQQHRRENNGDISFAVSYEVLALRRQPVRGL